MHLIHRLITTTATHKLANANLHDKGVTNEWRSLDSYSALKASVFIRVILGRTYPDKT